ncbi:MAG: trypsin-like serine protease [Pseudomonadota bacterium]
MRRLVFIAMAIVALSACSRTSDTLEPAPVDMKLPDLTLAELHRVSWEGTSRGRSAACEPQEDASWQCGQGETRTTTSRTYTVNAAPENIAPFAAQIFFHPQYVTQNDLMQAGLEAGLEDRPLWSTRHICGATLIARNWAVTASHCFKDPKHDNKYGIRLGVHSIASDAGHLYHVKEVVRFDPPGTPVRQNDIALVRFDPSETSANVISQRALEDMAPPAPAVLAASFQENETLLSAIDATGTYHAIDTETWQVLTSTSFKSRLDRIPDTNSLLSTVPDKGVTIAPLSGGDARFLEHEGVADSFLIDDGIAIISWSAEDGLIKASSRKVLKPMGRIEIPEGLETVRPIADSTLLFTIDKLGTQRVVDVFASDKTTQIVHERLAGEDLLLVRQSEDGRRLILRDFRLNELQVVDTLSDALVRSIILPETPSYWVDQDGSKVIFKNPYRLMIIDTMTGLDLADLPNLTRSVNVDLKLLDDGRHLLVRDPYGRLAELWDIESHVRISRMTLFSPTETVQTFEVSEPAKRAHVVTVRDNPDVPDSASPDSDTMTPRAYTPYLRQFYAFDLDTGEVIARVEPTNTQALGFEVFANDQKLLVWSHLGRSEVWDLSSCSPAVDKCTASFSIEHDVTLQNVYISADGRKLFAVTESGAVQVWDLESGARLQMVYHGGIVEGVTIWKDGAQFITYGRNGFLRLWDTKTGEELQRFSFKRPPRENADSSMSASNVDVIQPMAVAPDYVRSASAEPAENTVTYLRLDDTGDGLEDGAMVRAFGWGKFNRFVSGIRSRDMREAALQIISLEDCRSDDYFEPESQANLHERVFCARDEVRKTCVGDSGGPVIQGNTLEDARLVGIVSWGGTECTGDGTPGVYTRVASYTEWIESVIGADQSAE